MTKSRTFLITEMLTTDGGFWREPRERGDWSAAGYVPTRLLTDQLCIVYNVPATSCHVIMFIILILVKN